MKNYLLYNIKPGMVHDVAEEGTPENAERIAKWLKDNKICHAFIKQEFWSHWVLNVNETEATLLFLTFSDDDYLETSL